MKKFAMCLITLMALTLSSVQLKAVIPEEPSTTTAPAPKSEEVKALELRLNEIKAMDLAKMKSTDKKKLRKEVKSINHRMHDIGGGVYLSGAAIVVIIVLLLILL